MVDIKVQYCYPYQVIYKGNGILAVKGARENFVQTSYENKSIRSFLSMKWNAFRDNMLVGGDGKESRNGISEESYTTIKGKESFQAITNNIVMVGKVSPHLASFPLFKWSEELLQDKIWDFFRPFIQDVLQNYVCIQTRVKNWLELKANVLSKNRLKKEKIIIADVSLRKRKEPTLTQCFRMIRIITEQTETISAAALVHSRFAVKWRIRCRDWHDWL